MDRAKDYPLSPVMTKEGVADTYPQPSWPGLSRPSTPCLFRNRKEDVDARHKAGHDGGEIFPDDRMKLNGR
jgi:hypothetical protein